MVIPPVMRNYRREPDRLITAYPKRIDRAGWITCVFRVRGMPHGSMQYEIFVLEYSLQIGRVKKAAGSPSPLRIRELEEEIGRGLCDVLGRPVDPECFELIWRSMGRILKFKGECEWETIQPFFRKGPKLGRAAKLPGGYEQWRATEAEEKLRLPDGHADKLELVRKSDDVHHY